MLIARRKALAAVVLAPIAAGSARAEPIDEATSTNIEPTELAARNADAIRRHHAALNSGDVAVAAAFFAEDTRNHGAPVGRKGVLRVLTDIYETFPDWRMDIQNLAAIGDDVVVRVIVTGTHKGVGKIPVNGGLLVGVPPTGKSFKVQHIHWYTLKDGLIVEHRANRDDVGMMQELGLLPAVQRYDLPKQ
jgi:steroid delta-isomerase-like uncharacterized protein